MAFGSQQNKEIHKTPSRRLVISSMEAHRKGGMLATSGMGASGENLRKGGNDDGMEMLRWGMMGVWR